MADYQGIPVYQPPDALGTLSNLMGLKQRQLEMQRTELGIQGQTSQNQSLAAEAQKNTQAMQERQRVTQMFQSGQDDQGNNIRGPDGSPDPAKVIPALGRMAPLTGQDYAQNIIKTVTDHVGLQAASTNLDAKQRGMLMAPVQAAAVDPTMGTAQVNAGIDNLVQAHPEMANAAGYLKGLTAHLDKVPPEKRGQAIQSIAARLQPGEAVQTQPANATVDTGGAVQPGVVQPAVAGGGFAPAGKPIGKTLPPTLATLPSGSLTVLGGGAGNGPPSPKAPTPPPTNPLRRPDGTSRTAADDAPPPNAPKQQQEAYGTAVQGANAHVDSVRTADESYGNNMTIANTIRQLSRNANTGPGTETWNHVMGILGTDKANNYQELGAFLDRQAATIRGQMGLPGTNAGAEDSKNIAGNTGYNPKVIQDKNDYTQAMTEGLHQYRNGLDRVAGFSGQASPSAVNAFKAAWTQNFDPNVYKGELAYKRSKAEGDAFVRSLTPEEAKSLSAKRAALQALSQGNLPK